MESFTKFAGLDGAVALVTGGATGIGSAIVEKFLRQGSHVVFLDNNADAGGELIARLAPDAKIIPEFVYSDLKDLHSLKGTIKSIQQRAGPVKVLVNNAANDERHEMEEVTPEYWRERLATNLDHYFFCIRSPSLHRSQILGLEICERCRLGRQNSSAEYRKPREKGSSRRRISERSLSKIRKVLGRKSHTPYASTRILGVKNSEFRTPDC